MAKSNEELYDEEQSLIYEVHTFIDVYCEEYGSTVPTVEMIVDGMGLPEHNWYIVEMAVKSYMGKGVEKMALVIMINDTFNEEKALYDLAKEEVVVRGDYYHDKIDYVIQGYLLAKEIDAEDVEELYISPSHKLFKEFEFYDNDCEDDEYDD